MSDAFSAIIIVGAFVLPEVILGIIDASITLKFSKPLTFNFSSTTESSPLDPFYKFQLDEKLFEYVHYQL